MQAQQEGPGVEQSFGAAVQAVRAQRAMSQRTFADALAGEGVVVDASAISRIENGTRAVRLAEAVAIAKVLEVQLDFLLSGAATERAFDSAGRQYLNAERDLTHSAWLYTDAQLRLAAAADLEALGHEPLWEEESSRSRVRDIEYHETLERMQTSPVRVVRSVIEAALPSVSAGRGMLLTAALAQDWKRDAYYSAGDEGSAEIPSWDDDAPRVLTPEELARAEREGRLTRGPGWFLIRDPDAPETGGPDGEHPEAPER